jgi:chromate transporter
MFPAKSQPERKNRVKDLWDLFFTYMKIGFINFGGGYAMLPLLERELVNKRGWTTLDELRDYFAVGQCTPGVIALNVSTFIGQKRKGVAGALAAAAGFLLGPILIILLIAAFLTNFADLPEVQHAFAGIRVCVCVLILQAILRLWKKSVVDVFSFVLYAVILALNALGTFTSLLPVKIPAAVLVILAGITGLVVSVIRNKKSPARKEGDA